MTAKNDTDQQPHHHDQSEKRINMHYLDILTSNNIKKNMKSGEIDTTIIRLHTGDKWFYLSKLE